MTNKRILIIGGYGLAGSHIVPLLLRATSSSIIIAGRNLNKSTEMAKKLNREFSGNRVRGVAVDASDAVSVRKALYACDLVIACIPVSAGANVGIVRAAADARVDFVNLEMSSDERAELETISKSMHESGAHFLIDAGIFPGTPSMLVRLAASNSSNLESVTVGMIGCATQGSIETAKELISADIKSPYVYKDKDWHQVSMMASEKIDFGPPFGQRTCYPCNLDEIQGLPEELVVQELGLYAGETNAFVMLVLLIWNALKLNKFKKGVDWGARSFTWGLEKFAKPPFGITVKMKAVGKDRKQQKVYLHCEDVYIATAISVVASVLQVLDGAIKRPGLAFMGHAVDTGRFLNDAERLGMKISVERSMI
ncbi:MAG: KR domain-containing protein [Chloroflexi bacterium]|nr:KR domain-containing protein [Chloroflexota bacterium]